MQSQAKPEESQSVRSCPSLTDLVKTLILELKPLEVLCVHNE